MTRSLSLVLATLCLAGAVSAQVVNRSGSADGKPVVVKKGEVIPALDFRYKVLKVSVGAKEYVQRFDQRRLSQKPAFEADQLVVMDLEVQNLGEEPQDPTQFAFKLLDSEGGVSAPGLFDARLQSAVVVEGTASIPNLNQAELAPKGKTRIAVVFSIPRDARPKGLQLFASQRTVSQGAIIQYTGPLVATVELDSE